MSTIRVAKGSLGLTTNDIDMMMMMMTMMMIIIIIITIIIIIIIIIIITIIIVKITRMSVFAHKYRLGE